MKALSSENLQATFKKTCVLPFNKSAITDIDVALTIIFKTINQS
jgi:hypothetical protein